jgi:RecA/RadA recombinase
LLYDSRITIFVGHFGSGKTEIAVNSALALAARGDPVALVDLDVVKPYFRSRAAREVVTAAGVRLIVPEGEHFHADLPILVPQVRAVVRESRGKVLMDAGGDDTGARVLGSLADVIRPDDVDHLVVLNFRRPFTETVDAALGMIAAIEASSRLRVTGFVSNTHLLAETTLALIEDGLALARETARRAGRPLVAVAAEERFAADLAPRAGGLPVIRLTRHIRTPFDEPPRPRQVGPIFVGR